LSFLLVAKVNAETRFLGGVGGGQKPGFLIELFVNSKS